MKRSEDKTARPGPVELDEMDLGGTAGGGYELKNVLISSYQHSGTDGRSDIIVAADSGSGPHIEDSTLGDLR